MRSIDERVVAMAFENAKFEQAIAQTMRTLDSLNKALAQVGANSGFDKIEQQANKVNLQGPMSAIDRLKQKLGMGVNAKGIQDIEAAGNKVTLNGPLSALDKLKQKLGWVGGGSEISSLQGQSDRVDMSNLNNQVDEAKNHFDALRFAAIVAFGTIVHKATNMGLQLAKKLTIQPLIDGFHNYETQINAVQTIQANTGLTGKKGLNQIKGALGDLNEYANKTVYNFSEMAKNIGTFTAAGVDLKTATGSIKGIANLAAASGSSSQQASTAMYQLSQAIAAGRVNLQDWNSVVNAGMGGQMFQKALVNTAEAMGTLDAKSVTMGKHMKINGESFRNAIASKPGQKSWLTGDVLTQTLQNFTGDMSKAQLAAKGFNAEQIKVIQQQAKVAVDAATKIKTFSQMMDALKEEVASAWSGIWSTLFGDIGQAKALFTPLHNTLQNLLTGPVNAFNKALQSWAKLGGRTLLFKALQEGFKALGQILDQVKLAFRDIFPAKTGKDLLEMTKHFEHFTASLKASPATLNALRSTFRGLFAVLDIGWTIVKKVVGVIFDLLGVAKGGAGGFLAFTGGIGDFLTAIDKAIKKGHALDGFFNGLTAILRVPLHILGLIGHAFFGLFGGLDQGKAKSAADSLSTVSDSLKPMNRLVDNVKKGWQELVAFFDKLRAKVGPAVHHALEPIIHIGDTIMNGLKGIDSNKAASLLQTAFLGGIFVTLKKALAGGVSVTVGKLDGLNKVLGGLTANLKAMQQAIKAAVLLEIGVAILTLAAGIAILSRINPRALDRAMSAVAIGLGELVGALFLLSKATTGAGFATMPLLATSLIALAAAVTILAVAVKIFSTMSWNDMIKGLVGVGGALVAVGVGIKAIGAVRMTAMAPGLIAIAIAMNIMAVAVKQFGDLDWKQLLKGFLGISTSLLALSIGLDSIGPSLILVGPGLIAAALGMSIMAGAVAAFGAQKPETLVKGILGLGAALLTIAVAVAAIPPTVALTGAGLIVMSLALTALAGAVGVMGHLSLGTLIKGIVGIGGALVVLAVGLEAMAGGIPGSVALLAAAAALTLLVPTLGLLGKFKWGTIFKGLAAMAAALLTLSLIGTVASTGLLALGIALTAMAAAVLVAGTGLFLLGKGLSSISDTGARAIGVMIAAMTAFILAIPGLIINFIKGIVEALGEVAKIAPQVVDSLVKIVGSLLDVVIKSTPKMVQAIEGLIGAFITVVNDKSGPLIEAGWHLLLNFLSGISNHIVAVTNHAATIVIRFLSTLANRMPAIAAAGARFILAFLRGVGDHVANVTVMGLRIVRNFLRGIARAIPGIVGGVARIIVAFIRAVADNIPRIVKAGIHLARKFIRAVADALVALASVGAHAIIRFMNKLADVIEANAANFAHAGFRIGKAIMTGMLTAMSTLRKDASDSLNEAIFGNDRKLKKKDIGYLQQAKARGVKRSQLEGAFTEAELDAVYGKKPKHKAAAKAAGAPAHKTALDAVGVSSNPKITPVLDLTEVKKKSGELDTLTRPKQVAHVSLAHASAASRGTAALRSQQQPHRKETVVRPVQFVQNNHSPASLSTREIYRRTRNQLSQAKHKLNLIDGEVLLSN